MRIAVITDNGPQYLRFKKLTESYEYSAYQFDFFRSEHSKIVKLYEADIYYLRAIDVKKDSVFLSENYEIIFSLHCKQIFPSELVKNVKCINIHPGYNPMNRGWYPQVFAIIEGNVVGATIHEIDEQLDHGNIITREKLEIYPWETSIDVYERILNLEMFLLERWLPKILKNDYSPFCPENDGVIKTRNDFKKICRLDLTQKVTLGEAINRFRALSHGDYKNAFFIDEKTNNKIYVSINLEKR